MILKSGCQDKTQANAQLINGAYIQRWIMVCEGDLVKQSISISGLAMTNTDVLVRLEFINGTSQSVLLTPSRISFQVPAEASSLQIIGTYTWLGITHILLGWALHKLKHPRLLDWNETVTVYFIGSLASFWLLERVSAF